jgi:hypothetical protein
MCSACGRVAHSCRSRLGGIRVASRLCSLSAVTPSRSTAMSLVRSSTVGHHMSRLATHVHTPGHAHSCQLSYTPSSYTSVTLLRFGLRRVWWATICLLRFGLRRVWWATITTHMIASLPSSTDTSHMMKTTGGDEARHGISSMEM